jgi:hypothetical protein
LLHIPAGYSYRRINKEENNDGLIIPVVEYCGFEPLHWWQCFYLLHIAGTVPAKIFKN